jgi:DNA-binding MarR family transcriptional regulator
MLGKSLAQNGEESKEARLPFIRRFGRVLADHGIAAVPLLLFRLQGALGLSPQETWFIAYVLSYKWDERDPYPSLREISELSGVPRATLVAYKNSLVAKGFLRIRERRDERGRSLSHVYDFTPLFRRMEKLIETIEGQNGTEDQSGEGQPVDRGGSAGRPEEDEYEEEKNKKNMHAAPPSSSGILDQMREFGLEEKAISELAAQFSPEELSLGMKLVRRKRKVLDKPAFLYQGFKEGWLVEKVRKARHCWKCPQCGRVTTGLIEGLCSECYFRRWG